MTRIAQTLVTGADALPDGRIVVRDYGSATVYRWQDDDLVADAQVDAADAAAGRGRSPSSRAGGRRS